MSFLIVWSMLARSMSFLIVWSMSFLIVWTRYFLDMHLLNYDAVYFFIAMCCKLIGSVTGFSNISPSVTWGDI